MEYEKKLVANRIQTPDGTILWSRFCHDFVSYKDANGVEYVLDGGNDYQRCYCEQDWPEELKSKNISVYNDAPWEIQRDVILRGTFDRTDGHRIWVPLSKLSDGHLKSIINDLKKDDLFGGYNKNNRYEKEIKYRKQNNIRISDHDYKDEQIYSISKSL